MRETVADCERGFDLALVMRMAMGLSFREGVASLIAERRRWMSVAMSSPVLGWLL